MATRGRGKLKGFCHLWANRVDMSGVVEKVSGLMIKVDMGLGHGLPGPQSLNIHAEPNSKNKKLKGRTLSQVGRA